MPTSRLVHIVDDEASVRDALTLLLQTSGIEVRVHGSSEEFLANVSLDSPVCILLDLRLPGLSGLDLVRQLQRLPAQPVVVMISGHGDVAMAVAAMRAGAFHFIEKPFDPAELLLTVEEALQKAARLAEEAAFATAAAARFRALTPREQEVMSLLAEGLPTKAIATRLAISSRTAEHHRASVMRKMNARTISHLVRMSMQLRQGEARDNAR